MSIVIVNAKRTAIGAFGGTLKDMPATTFTATLAKEMMDEIGLSPDEVNEVIIGNILQAGQGQNPARQVAVKAGIPIKVPAFTVNKVCGSGMKSVMLAVQAIKCGDADCIIAGGMENMSQAPYLMTQPRWGAKFGHFETKDSMIQDGLWDAFNDYHMGITAENLVDKYSISREEQDAFATQSQNRCEVAVTQGKFKDEIIPITIKTRKSETVFDCDEYPKAGVTVEGLAKLRPAFKKDGSVTAANSSGLNDGAALLIVMSREKAEELGLTILAEIDGYTSAGVAPEEMGIGPVAATRKLLAKTESTLNDFDLFEYNEAFASQSLAVLRELDVDPAKVNVNGGAIALGHPIGASGARIIVTLIHEMRRQGLKRGLASLCIGGGMGTALSVNCN